MQEFTSVSVEDAFSGKCAGASCRSCGQVGLLGVMDLGPMPLADSLASTEGLSSAQPKYPLEVAFCPHCSLVQILHTVPPDKLFCEDYPYYSSFSDALLEHSRQNAVELIESRHLHSGSFVVELASNDGYLLRNFVERGVPALGIDPAEGPAKAAAKAGVPTLCAFFGRELAEQLRAEGKAADVVIANNVLAHVADLNGFVEGISLLLKEEGVAVIEVPYVRDLVECCEFDTVYHEHLCYFSLTALDRVFRRHGLFLNDARKLAIHGGSLRLYVQRRQAVRPAVVEALMEETRLGMHRYGYFQGFGSRVDRLRRQLCGLLAELKGSAKRIAAYGAAAKGSVLLNSIGAGKNIIDFVVDRNVHKQGKYMPGLCIPICDPARLLQDKPDYVLLLTWNFKDEILRQQQGYCRQGGRFIIPIPQVQIVPDRQVKQP